ncbi:MAG: biotin/lipoate--protein ligase family protein [Paracoccus hibiscisoli]|uniref:biotin/lipoate--protein ligase family protein n=1 Tax=Paracoccus hibiscisoli TaxID=2023261 RepID=UPI00391CF484
MPSDIAAQPRTAPTGPRIPLPPPFDLIRTDHRDALAHAARLAPDHGAGALVLHQSPGLLAFAVVLEPEQVLAEARQAFILGMAALADTLAAHCPPERPVCIHWPDLLLYDAARIGGGRLAAPDHCAEDAVPEWLVFGVELIADRDHLDETGLYPDSTSLREEDFDPAEDIVSTFASYLMLYFDRWTHTGFGAVTDAFIRRIGPDLPTGQRRIEACRLIETTAGGVVRDYPTLRDALSQQGWRDDVGPRL